MISDTFKNDWRALAKIRGKYNCHVNSTFFIANAATVGQLVFLRNIAVVIVEKKFYEIYILAILCSCVLVNWLQ